jgi:hypothetical protein
LWRLGRLSRDQNSAITTGKRVPLYVRGLPRAKDPTPNDTANCDQPVGPTSGDWWAMALRLRDNGDPANPRYVNVASLHLKTGQNDCAWENMKLLNGELGVSPVNMQIMAGDTNHADAPVPNNSTVAWECWYNGTNASLGTCGNTVPNLNWKDVMYRKWIAAASDRDRYDLMHTNEWTYALDWPNNPGLVDRRDYIFTRTYSIANDPNQPTQQPQTVRWEDAGGTAPRYSDHRGLGALLRYCLGNSLPGCSTGA